LKTNNLTYFKNFPEQCDIFKNPFALRLLAFAVKFTLFSKHYTYQSIIMQNLKSTDRRKNSTENIL